MREKTCVFIGHGECYGVSLEQIEKELERLIDWGITDFLCGGMGRFDWMCARDVYELKKYRKNIRCDLNIPYLTFRILWISPKKLSRRNKKMLTSTPLQALQ